ncbi:hypothetical protein HMPREF0530_0739, partial [Lacticaseibacillus paracasei subsp. paracasei ATCC 25302 = DSM 5622 = JCM 8130]
RYIEALWTNNMIFGNVLKGLSAIVTCAAIYVLIRCLHEKYASNPKLHASKHQ